MSGKQRKRGDGGAARTGSDQARGREPAAQPDGAHPGAPGGKGSFTPPGQAPTIPTEGAPDAQVEPQDPERGPAPGEQARRASEAHPSLREDERPLSRGDPGRDPGLVQP